MFAYGSTGAGKTHTMLGTAAEPGIIFLTVMELYSRISAMSDTRCQVAVSYVEVGFVMLLAPHLFTVDCLRTLLWTWLF